MSDRDNDPWPPVDAETAAAFRYLQHVDLPPLDGPPRPPEPSPAVQAAVLRATAALLREHADAATPGPWQHMCMGSDGCLVLRKTGTVRERGHGRVAKFGQKEWIPDHNDAAYVTLMSPALGSVLADWLDVKAANLECVAAGTGRRDHDYGYANAVARAILGDETEG